MRLEEDFDLQISFDKEEQLVYIGTETSSGAKYDCKNIEDLKKAINEYIDDYVIPYDKDNDYEEDMDK